MTGGARQRPGGLRLSGWLLALIAVCVLPLTALAAWLAAQGVAALSAQQEREAVAKAQDVATAIDQELQARLGALQVLGGSPLFDDPARWAELHREASAFRLVFGSHVVVAGPGAQPDGPMRMLLNTRVPFGQALPPLPRPSGRAAAPLALATGRPAVGDLFAGPVAGEALLAMAVPAGGRPGHVVLSTPEARQFQQRLDQVALPPQWALSLLDSRGEFIARRLPPGFVPAAAASSEGRYRAALSAAPWQVLLEIPPPVLAAPAQQAALALAGTIVLSMLLTVGAGLLAARRLHRAVRSLASGDARGARSTGIVEIDEARARLDDALQRQDDAMQALRAAEAQSRATFELANVGIAQVGLDGRWLRVNRRLLEIVGYGQAELLASTFQDITHPDDLANDLDHLRRLLAGEIPAYEIDKRYRHRDGRELWVTLAVALVRRADGAPDYFISVVDDISERKRLERRSREQFEQLAHGEAEGRRLLALSEEARLALLGVLQDRKLAEDALRASEARLRNIFEQASDGIFVLSAGHQFLDANERGLELLGRSRGELLGRRVADVLAAHELSRPALELSRMMGGEPLLTEWDLLRRDGTVFPAEASAKRLDEHSYLAIVRDLTERRRAEASLRDSEAYRRRLFEQMADGVLLIDQDGTIGDANPSAEAMFGCAAGELVAHRLDELLAEAERGRWAGEAQHMAQGLAKLSEWELLRRDGKTVPAELSARPLDAGHLIVVLRDVSARRAAEQALLRYQMELSDLTQRLLAQERAATRRVAQALHDRLGQTLALARLRLGAMSLRDGQATPAERAAALEQLGQLIEQAVAEARQVLTDLRPPLLESEGLAAGLDNELRSPALAAAAGSASASLVLQVTPAAQAQRWPADAEYAAFMVAREAVANALRHAHAGRVGVRLDGGPSWLRLEVEDDGVGLAPELAQGRPGHLGIVGMRERALAIGAHFAVAARPEGGTRATLIWGRQAI